MHPMSTASLYRVGAGSVRLQCNAAQHTRTALKSGNFKFVRSKSSKASATKAPDSTATTAKLEAKLKARAEKGDVPSETEKQLLPWGEYLAIRKNKRRWETTITIPLAVGGFTVGVLTFGGMEMDPTKPIFNLDPMVVYGAATLGCAGAGYLIGPIIGSALWRFMNRNTMRLIEARDKEFHNHIVKNRVDPAAQSATNPVPDFYGEKIGSLHDYRQWLRDQAKYKRKAALPED
ncbi:hypothetical protein EIP86_002341 [Pleurotus ostreatoroseus]|nr:hypothetical protein EIP86_002341 [Pleurotus ostreatoroseus]